MNQLGKLLKLIGRTTEESIAICTMDPSGPPLMTEWTTVADAQDVSERFSGERHVWYTVQPMNRPAGGRGGQKDVAEIVALYADLDYVTEGKPSGISSEVALRIIHDLAEIVGSMPVAIVGSGHGLQPLWAVERVDVIDGVRLMHLWKALVIQVAADHGVTVDESVLADRARILRVPGPPNLKFGESAKTGAVFPADARTLAVAELELAFQEALPSFAPRSFTFGSESRLSVASRGASLSPWDDERCDYVFRDDAEALDHIERFALSRVRETGFGSGEDFWKVIWEAALLVSNFSEMFDEEDLRDMIRQAIRDGHGVDADRNDEYQMALGFAKGRTRIARYPSAEELSNPFSPYCNLQASVRERYDIPENVELTVEVVYAVADDPQSAAPSAADGVRRLKVTSAGDIEMEAAEWLWEHSGEFWLPLRSLVLLGGREGVGKSTWTARLIAQVTNGKMHGEFLGKPKGVAICAAEDSWEVTILPRLVAAGADVRRVWRVEAEQSGQIFGLTLPTDVPALERMVREKDVALIVLDPLLGTVQGKLDTHKDSDVRQALAPISALAHETHCTVIGLIHQNKNQAGDLLTRMMGSRAFAAVARAVLVCAEAPPAHEAGEFDLLKAAEPSDEPKAPRQFLFGQLKNNLGPRVETSVKYEIEGVVVGNPLAKKPIRTSKIKVIKYGDVADVEETVLAKEKAQRESIDKRRKPEGNAIERCQAWIKATLDINGPMQRSALQVGANDAGFSDVTFRKAIPSMDLKTGGQVGNLEYSLSWSPSAQADDK